jgi:hypothetical protein
MGLARTLSEPLRTEYSPTAYRAFRRPDATQARHRIGLPQQSYSEAFPVPAGVAWDYTQSASTPDMEASPRRMSPILAITFPGPNTVY